MVTSRRVDIVVIGAGTAGLSAADEIDRAGHSALVVDHGPLGTMCIRVGCMPSKAMLHAGRRYTMANELARWSKAEATRIRQRLWGEVRAIRQHLIDDEVKKTHRKLGKRLLVGSARFVGPNTIDVGGERIEAGAFVIATGSSPVLPKELSSLGAGVLTTDTLFDLDRLPASMGVIGIGNVGVELGLACARLGLRVVAANEKPWPAGIVDPRIAACAKTTFAREMTMRLRAKAEVRRHGAAFRMRIGEEEHAVDRVLVAIGRKPNLAKLDLAAAGVAWDPDGDEPPPIDERTLRMGRLPLFVAGDASPERPLLHEAIDEGGIAARGAIAVVSSKKIPKARRRTPFDIVFTDPDIVRVGRNYDALDRDATLIGTATGAHNGRSAICGAQDNLVRVYADRAGRLIGAAAISLRGEHLAHLVALAIDRGLTASQLLAAPFYHPTFEEMLQSALEDVVEQQKR